MQDLLGTDKLQEKREHVLTVDRAGFSCPTRRNEPSIMRPLSGIDLYICPEVI